MPEDVQPAADVRVAIIADILIRRHFSRETPLIPTSQAIGITASLMVRALDDILVTPKTFPPETLLDRIARALTNADAMIPIGAQQDLDALASVVRSLRVQTERATLQVEREIRARDTLAQSNEALRARISALEGEAIGIIETLVRQNDSIQVLLRNAIACGEHARSARAGGASGGEIVEG